MKLWKKDVRMYEKKMSLNVFEVQIILFFTSELSPLPHTLETTSGSVLVSVTSQRLVSCQHNFGPLLPGVACSSRLPSVLMGRHTNHIQLVKRHNISCKNGEARLRKAGKVGPGLGGRSRVAKQHKHHRVSRPKDTNPPKKFSRGEGWKDWSKQLPTRVWIIPVGI